jgi:hypothetical protein
MTGSGPGSLIYRDNLIRDKIPVINPKTFLFRLVGTPQLFQTEGSS